MLGVIAGRHPGIIDVAILAACPRDVPSWRASGTGRPWPNSLSPHAFLADVQKATQLFVVVGSNDNNTLPKFSEAYVSAAKVAGLTAQLVALSGVGHNMDLAMQTAIVRVLANALVK